jgi:hypothetical protein
MNQGVNVIRNGIAKASRLPDRKSLAILSSRSTLASTCPNLKRCLWRAFLAANEGDGMPATCRRDRALSSFVGALRQDRQQLVSRFVSSYRGICSGRTKEVGINAMQTSPTNYEYPLFGPALAPSGVERVRCLSLKDKHIRHTVDNDANDRVPTLALSYLLSTRYDTSREVGLGYADEAARVIGRVGWCGRITALGESAG